MTWKTSGPGQTYVYRPTAGHQFIAGQPVDIHIERQDQSIGCDLGIDNLQRKQHAVEYRSVGFAELDRLLFGRTSSTTVGEYQAVRTRFRESDVTTRIRFNGYGCERLHEQRER